MHAQRSGKCADAFRPPLPPPIHCFRVWTSCQSCLFGPCCPQTIPDDPPPCTRTRTRTCAVADPQPTGAGARRHRRDPGSAACVRCTWLAVGAAWPEPSRHTFIAHVAALRLLTPGLLPCCRALLAAIGNLANGAVAVAHVQRAGAVDHRGCRGRPARRAGKTGFAGKEQQPGHHAWPGAGQCRCAVYGNSCFLAGTIVNPAPPPAPATAAPTILERRVLASEAHKAHQGGCAAQQLVGASLTGRVGQRVPINCATACYMMQMALTNPCKHM